MLLLRFHLLFWHIFTNMINTCRWGEMQAKENPHNLFLIYLPLWKHIFSFFLLATFICLVVKEGLFITARLAGPVTGTVERLFLANKKKQTVCLYYLLSKNVFSWTSEGLDLSIEPVCFHSPGLGVRTEWCLPSLFAETQLTWDCSYATLLHAESAGFLLLHVIGPWEFQRDDVLCWTSVNVREESLFGLKSGSFNMMENAFTLTVRCNICLCM